MKKLSLICTLALLAFSCQLQDEANLSDEASGAADINDYSVSGSSSDDFTFTFNIELNDGAKNISHVMFYFKDCDGNNLSFDNITAFTVDGEDAMGLLAVWTGQNDDCFGLTNEFYTKLDQGYDHDIVVTVTLDAKSSGGTVYIKAGSANSPTGGGCFGPYEFENDCTPDKCYETQEETAWAAGQRYVTRGNWATYTAYQGGTVNIYAGQHMFAGTASFSAVSDGMVTITMSLNEGWGLQEGNSVKIQDYATPPSGNPSPGRFAHKGSSLVVSVPANNYYGIHLDVQALVEVPCE
jgi:hypothetical protein